MIYKISSNKINNYKIYINNKLKKYNKYQMKILNQKIN